MPCVLWYHLCSFDTLFFCPILSNVSWFDIWPIRPRRSPISDINEITMSILFVYARLDPLITYRNNNSSPSRQYGATNPPWTGALFNSSKRGTESNIQVAFGHHIFKAPLSNGLKYTPRGFGPGCRLEVFQRSTYMVRPYHLFLVSEHYKVMITRRPASPVAINCKPCRSQCAPSDGLNFVT